MLFNLYVTDLPDNLPVDVKSFQYADDTTIYTSCTVPSIASKARDLNSSLASLGTWSKHSNLALNAKKTKSMLISTSQMARVHSLSTHELGLTISEMPLERVRLFKLLGVHIDEHLKWDEHISHLLKSCYGVLRTLRKLKNFTEFKLRKQLAETLIISKLDYCDVVFHPLPQFLLNRLQRLQFATASFVTCKYVDNINTVLKLGWLPVKERRDYSLLKHAFKAINYNKWPSYLQLEVVCNSRNLRSSAHTALTIPLEKGTFQDSAAALFNSLPASTRDCNDFNRFCKLTRAFLIERASNTGV